MRSPTKFVCLLEFSLSQLGRTSLDVGESGDFFFRAVLHQLYGNPNSHFYLRSIGIQYLVNHPKPSGILLMQIFPSPIPLCGQEIINLPKIASLIHSVDQTLPSKGTGASISKMV